MRLKSTDYLLVGNQIFLFLLYLYNVPSFDIVFPTFVNKIGLGVSILGFAILITAILQLNRNLSPFPTPKSDSVLIETGLYKYVRHPIYTGILLLCIGYGVYDNSGYKLLVSLLLYVLFFIKSLYEEQKLKAKFEGYVIYMRKTSRFFPKP